MVRPAERERTCERSLWKFRLKPDSAGERAGLKSPRRGAYGHGSACASLPVRDPGRILDRPVIGLTQPACRLFPELP